MAKYDLTNINDIEKTIINFQVKPQFDLENKTVQLGFENYDSLKVMFTTAIERYDLTNISIENVASYEKDAAAIKKVADRLKNDAQAYAESITLNLLGRTRGKNKVQGQVQILTDILMKGYNEIHEQTKAIREKAKETENSNETKETINNTIKVELTLDSALKQELEIFCKKHNIKIKEIK